MSEDGDATVVLERQSNMDISATPTTPHRSRRAGTIVVLPVSICSVRGKCKMALGATIRSIIIVFLTLLCSFLDVPAECQTAINADRAKSHESRQYFPAGVFDEDPTLSSFKERWYSSYLSEMDELSLFEIAKNDGPSTFRFLLVWMNHALSACLTLNSDGTGLLVGKALVAKHSGGPRSDKPEIIVNDASTTVGREQVRQFETLLQKADFWSLKTSEPSGDGLDGFEWVLEGSRHNSYHVVDRWSPKENEYTHVCRYLMNLSPLKLDEGTRKSLP